MKVELLRGARTRFLRQVSACLSGTRRTWVTVYLGAFTSRQATLTEDEGLK